MSSSRQFIIFGGNNELRGSFCGAAESIKSRTLSTLQTADRWKVAILINLRPLQANLPEITPAGLRFSQTGAGLKIQIDLLVSKEFEPSSLTRELTRALLLEMSYREFPDLPAGQPYTAPPDWLVEGLIGGGGVVEPAVAKVNLMSLPNLLRQNPVLLDSPSRAIYRAQATQLVRILTALDGGARALVALIKHLPRASSDPLINLQQHFPALGPTPQALEQNWRALVAQISGTESSLLAEFSGTARDLDELLATKIAGRGRVSFADACGNPRVTIDRKTTEALSQRLMLLTPRAHPLLRPIVLDYQRAADALAKNKRRGLAARVERAGELRSKLAERMERVEDYLNWFEATQAGSNSGEFAVISTPRKTPRPRRAATIRSRFTSMPWKPRCNSAPICSRAACSLSLPSRLPGATEANAENWI